MDSRQTEGFFSLAKHVIADPQHKNKNLVFSPMSIHVLLAMTAAGSTGPTLDRFLRFLRSDSSLDLHAGFSWIMNTVLADPSPLGGPVLSSANGLWVDQTLHLKPAFRDIARKSYRAATEHVDFQKKAEEARGQVNAWAEKETNGLIKEILQSGSVHSLTSMILANAIYFKGAWYEPFDPLTTRDNDFYLLNGGSVRSPFMTSYKKQYLCVCNGFKVLKMRYNRGEDDRIFSLSIFLPDAKDGLQALVDGVCSDSSKRYPFEYVRLVDFRIPKFKFGFGFDASAVLQKLGLGGVELSEMVDDPLPLDGSGIFHKSFIEVNEEGTEAAAVSAFMVAGCPPMKPPPVIYSFVADHPFLFVIREERSNVVLFIGQLLNPLDA